LGALYVNISGPFFERKKMPGIGWVMHLIDAQRSALRWCILCTKPPVAVIKRESWALRGYGTL
jgi:hypothetical protein